QGDLLLLSSDFFPLDSGLLRELIRSHQKSGSLLTLIAKKVRADSRYQSEDYFVLPGLAAISLRKGLGWLKKIRAFKPTGQLDIVALVEASEKSEETPNFLWLQDSGGTEAVWLNEQEDLSLVASILNKRKLAELEKRGVFFLSPNEVWLDPEVEIGPGTVIYPSVVIEGQTKIGKDCLIYPHCHIVNSWIGNRVKVLGATVIEGCRLEAEAQVGPFSRLRPETRLAAGSRVGNFVEMKKTFFGRGSKAMHLSYLGDATVEEMVNVGAGTITCNYDGQKKNKTYIGKGAFIGSGTELVAPVKIGRGAYIAAGSTITENVSSEALAIARARQVEKPGWVRRRKQKLASTENNQKKKK
ncbi:MAG: DapH/DapD/GlmU-related protein, partial [Candidatus Saccharicenans sp.]